MTKNIEYVLYDFKGKIQWLYLSGTFVVDTESQEEFLLSNPTAIMLGGK